MNIELIGDYVLVEPDTSEDLTPGGIVIPDNAQMKPEKGTVIAIGIGRLLKNGERQAPQAKVGDYVMYGNPLAHPVEVDGRKYIVIHEADMLGIIKGEAK